ncbi:MAG: carboxypeptidase regulatory-like domain-containing protein [Bacteroidota bacterium]
MKKILTFPVFMLIITCLGFQMTSERTEGILAGTVTDGTTGEPLIGASVVIAGTKTGTTTDFDGKYHLKLAAGTYDVTFRYLGFTSKNEKNVRIQSGKTTPLNIQMEAADEALEELLIVGYASKSPKATTRSKEMVTAPEGTFDFSTAPVTVETDAVPMTITTRSEDMSGDIMLGDAVLAEEVVTMDETALWIDGVRVDNVTKEISIADSYLKTAVFLLDGKVVSKNLIPMKELNTLEIHAARKKKAAEIAEKLAAEKEKKQLPKAGQLTAGEWNDLEHWKDWQKLEKESNYQSAKKDWDLNLTNRYAVLIENKNKQPLADVKVELHNENGKVLWNARTDNFGKAELWTGIFDEKEQGGKLKIIAHYDGKKYTIKKAKPFKKVNKLKIKTACDISNQVDIVFAVDATGSMQDEINYLKSELQDVIQRVKNADNDLAIRLGSVFYRDQQDAYLTRVSPLDKNIQRTVDFIQNQNADGGGDFPEAVDIALEEAIQKQYWSDDAIARIVFLVLDAPPHMGIHNIQSIQNSIRLAAAKGIKIIPITASGINRSTEYLMKALAMTTNGTYVFITDHSGIGGAHLEPSTKDYQVELLNDLMVRLIGKYTDRSACEEEEEVVEPQFQIDPNQQTPNSTTLVFKNDPTLLNKVRYFPNPATDFITIQLQETISSIEIISSNGQVVKRLENAPAGEEEIDLSGLSEGFYLVRFTKDKSVASGKLIIIKP